MKTITDTDLCHLDFELVKAHVVESFHGTEASKEMVVNEKNEECDSQRKCQASPKGDYFSSC